MEKEGYRENLELLRETFPGRGAITVKEAAEFLGAALSTVYSAMERRRNPLPSQHLDGKKLIPIVPFARWLSV